MWILWFVIAVVLALMLMSKIGEGKLAASPDERMQLWKAALLLGYLLILTAISIYAVFGLWAAEPQDASNVPKNEPSSCGPDAQLPPEIRDLDPEQVYLGSSRSNIRILGCHLNPTDKVTFNGLVRDSQYVDSQQIVVTLNNSDFGSPGNIVVALSRGSSASQNGPGDATAAPPQSKILGVQSAFQSKGTWNFFPWSWQISQESRLLLLVLLTGALGSSVYALKSLADYLGDKKLYESWFTFYLVQPFEGAGVAYIFYLVMRGGFLAGTNSDAKAVNPYGISAIAALVGIFSDLAFAKLREVFESLFQPKDDRTGAIEAKLAIKTKSPLPPAALSKAYSVQLAAVNGSPPYTWSLTVPADLPDGLKLNENTGELSGTPSTAVAAAKFEVKVTDRTGSSAVGQFELTVS
jgi:hypothetical protein